MSTRLVTLKGSRLLILIWPMRAYGIWGASPHDIHSAFRILTTDASVT